MTSKHKEIGDKLRNSREACALSQQQVADALNIDRSTYTKYETGDTEPSLNTIVALAAIYNVSPMELLPVSSPGAESVRSLRDVVRSDSPIYQLTRDERGLIAKYRVLDKEQKKQAHVLIGNLSKKEEQNPVK